MRIVPPSKPFGFRPVFLSLAMLIAMLAVGCLPKHEENMLKAFAQRGHATVFELTDRNGRAWKVVSGEGSKITTYWVINSSGQIDIIDVPLPVRDGTTSAVVYVDSSEKEEALAVLDKKFLSALSNPSDGYRQWLSTKAIFTYGALQQTRMIDVKPGGLGTTSIGTKGGQITGLLSHSPCHCYELPGSCGGLPSPFIPCVNSICDVVNCTIDVINGKSTGCNGDVAKAQTACSLALGLPPP
jgi:hypothetical protein